MIYATKTGLVYMYEYLVINTGLSNFITMSQYRVVNKYEWTLGEIFHISLHDCQNEVLLSFCQNKDFQTSNVLQLKKS